MGQAQTKPGCITTTTTLFVKPGKYPEVQQYFFPILKEFGTKKGLMSATISKVSDAQLVLYIMYDSMASLDANEMYIDSSLKDLDKYMSKKPEVVTGEVSHCVGLGVGLAAKASMPAGVMTPNGDARSKLEDLKSEPTGGMMCCTGP